jgi:hypothetical protein
MRKRTSIGIVAAVALALSASTIGVANALWSASATALVPEIATGSVNFSAQASTSETKEISVGGASVSVTLPGSKLIEVLQQDAVAPVPVIWRFTASGSALGIAGLNYGVTVREQRTAEGSHDLASGRAKKGTVLAGSTLKVYRAAAGGDCSTVPVTPTPKDDESPRNVYLYDSDDVQLQTPGTALTGRLSEQEWCVAMTWNAELDGLYVNDVQVIGTAANGSTNGAMARWHAPVGFPPSLDMLGTYRNQGSITGISEDTTKAKATSEWHTDVYPDPSGEPSIVIELDPIVTNLNPALEAQD